MHRQMKKKVKVGDTLKGYAAPRKVSKAAGGGIHFRPPKVKYQSSKD